MLLKRQMEHPKACRNEEVLQAPLLLLNMQTEKPQANVKHGESQEQQTQEPFQSVRPSGGGPEETVAHLLKYTKNTLFYGAQPYVNR